jgi:hypothetical protein
MDWEYYIKVWTPIGSAYTEQMDLNRCLDDVGIDTRMVFGIGSYAGNMEFHDVKNDRIVVTGSAGYLVYNEAWNVIAEIKNQIIFDKQGPAQTGGVPQTSVQVVTVNKLTGDKHTYKPPSQHFIPDAQGTIEITDLKKDQFIFTTFINPHAT